MWFIQRDLARLAHDLAEGPIGDSLACRSAPATEHAELRNPGPRPVQKLTDESALADPGRSENEAQMRSSCPDGIVKELLEGVQLAIAPEKRRLQVAGHQTPQRQAHESAGRYRRAPTLHLDLSRHVELEFERGRVYG